MIRSPLNWAHICGVGCDSESVDDGSSESGRCDRAVPGECVPDFFGESEKPSVTIEGEMKNAGRILNFIRMN